MPYEHFSAEDFLLDETFKKWLLDPDPVTIYFWEHWLKQHPEKRDVVEEAKEILRHIHFKDYSLSADESQHMWKEIMNGRKALTEPEVLPFAKVRHLASDGFGYAVRIAAVLLILLLAGLSFYVISNHQSKVEYLTRYGETQRILLPDKSLIVLNGNSKLVIPSHWSFRDSREVWLEGEAFFHVQKKPAEDEGRQGQQEYIGFTVHTNNVDVRVLGTEFNVNDRRGRTRVMLQRGSVQLKLNIVQPGRQLMMKPEDMVEVSAEKEQIIRRKVNPELYASWTHNKLILNNTPLYEIAAVLEDTFGYNVVFKDPDQANRLIRGVLPLNDVDILLEAIANSLDLKVTKDKKDVIFERQ
jgi:transmembrane sensor